MTYQWYIIHTLSGSERKIKQLILDQAEKRDMSSLFKEIVVPSIEIPEVKHGKHITTEKKIMPGYILINMNMTDEAWRIVKGIPKVTGFLGSDNKPTPVSQKEIEVILRQLEVKSRAVNLLAKFEIGEIVNIIDGPFESFSGAVEEINETEGKMVVAVNIFGRPTPIHLTFNQVKKA